MSIADVKATLEDVSLSGLRERVDMLEETDGVA